MSYDWGESPHAFTHRFVCQHAIIVTKFPNEKFPKRDQTIKRKLWYGLPTDSRERLEGFPDEEYPLRKFLDRVEYERQRLEDRNIPQVNRIPGGKNAEKGKVGEPQETEVTKDEIEHLRKQILELKASLTHEKPEPLRDRRPLSDKYCAYCQRDTHNLIDCWRKPPVGHCFDCRRPAGCRRGDRRCPGRNYGASGTNVFIPSSTQRSSTQL